MPALHLGDVVRYFAVEMVFLRTRDCARSFKQVTIAGRRAFESRATGPSRRFHYKTPLPAPEMIIDFRRTGTPSHGHRLETAKQGFRSVDSKTTRQLRLGLTERLATFRRASTVPRERLPTKRVEYPSLEAAKRPCVSG